MPFVLFADSKIEMRGRDDPTGRAKFVNTGFSCDERDKKHVYKIIFVLMI